MIFSTFVFLFILAVLCFTIWGVDVVLRAWTRHTDRIATLKRDLAYALQRNKQLELENTMLIVSRNMAQTVAERKIKRGLHLITPQAG